MEISEIENNNSFKKMVADQFDPENSISFEQFQEKTISCDITGEPCKCGECCIGCKIAEAHVKDSLKEDNISLFPTDDESRNGVDYKGNWNDSFYEFDSLNSLRRVLPHTGWIAKLEKLQELPAGVKEKYHVWNECSEVIFSMYKFSEFMYAEKCPLIVVCEDRIFVEPPYE